jgi:hypothetical protein
MINYSSSRKRNVGALFDSSLTNAGYTFTHAFDKQPGVHLVYLSYNVSMTTNGVIIIYGGTKNAVFLGHGHDHNRRARSII